MMGVIHDSKSKDNEHLQKEMTVLETDGNESRQYIHLRITDTGKINGTVMKS